MPSAMRFRLVPRARKEASLQPLSNVCGTLLTKIGYREIDPKRGSCRAGRRKATDRQAGLEALAASTAFHHGGRGALARFIMGT